MKGQKYINLCSENESIFKFWVNWPFQQYPFATGYFLRHVNNFSYTVILRTTALLNEIILFNLAWMVSINQHRIRNVHFIMKILGSDFTVSSLRLEENIVANHQHLPKGFTSLLDARDLKKVKHFWMVYERWFSTHLHGLSPTQSLPCSSHSHHPYGLEPGRCMWFPAWVRLPSCCWIWSSGQCSSDPAGSIVGKNGMINEQGSILWGRMSGSITPIPESLPVLQTPGGCVNSVESSIMDRLTFTETNEEQENKPCGLNSDQSIAN